MIKRQAFGLDENRPDSGGETAAKKQRTARANIEDLCDPGSFIEYGALAIAAQRGRRSVDDLIGKTPADGHDRGRRIRKRLFFPEDKARCMVMAYDYTVLAGTQGYFNHKKMDRMLKLAYEQRLPLVFFAEGGGGRPGDVDATGVMAAGLDLSRSLRSRDSAACSGRRRCIRTLFCGQRGPLGCCDVIIATKNSNIGMGGPVMIEGGGLGVFKPEEIGPMDVQTQNGVVDIEVADDSRGGRRR